MDCCQRDLIESQFDRDTVAYKVRQYRKQGPKKETAILADALAAEGIEGYTLLDVGGGLGVLAFELFKAGISTATNVEASSAYIEASRAEASKHGISGEMVHLHGDFVHLAEQIAPADIVTLDKVVCCYDDLVSLVRASADRARQFYGLIYPRDTWWVKAAIWAENFLRKLKGNDFRLHVHPTEAVDRIVRKSGMELCFQRLLIDWQIVIYRRRSA